MSPEGPGSLVVLDLSVDGQGNWSGEIDRFDPLGATQWLRVSWSAVSCTGNRVPAGGGVVCVTVPEVGYRRERYPVDGLTAGAGRLHWRDKAPGEGLMLVIVLPIGWIIPSARDASRPPVDVKIFCGRFAAYWMMHDGRDFVWWNVSEATGTAMNQHVDAFQVELTPGAPVVLE
jgi:hypothetical protein